MHKKIIVAIIGALVVVAVCLAVFRPQPTPSVNVPVAATIKMTTDGFSPAEVSIKVGQAIKFVNAADPSCNIQSTDCNFWPASNPHPTHELYPEFDPRQPVGPGESWTFVFGRAGDWGFHDHFHYTNRGTVHVMQ